MSPESRRQELFLLSPRNICVSLAINIDARFKVFELAKLGDIEGNYLARRVSKFSKAFSIKKTTRPCGLLSLVGKGEKEGKIFNLKKGEIVEIQY